MTANSRHSISAGIAALALAVPVGLGTAAEAAPDDKPASASQTKQLVKAITVKDTRLERLSTANRTAALDDDTETLVVSNIGDDREALATLKAEAEAAESTLDLRAARQELRDFRVVNYVLSVNILRQAQQIEDEAAADPEATTHLQEAVAAALDLTAESTKSDVREARKHLQLAKQELDDEVEEPAPTS